MAVGQGSDRTFSSLAIETKTGNYSLDFLPDVFIANEGDAYDRWMSFVETIAPKTRLGEDPKTGTVGLLYRDGSWLGDLMFADDVRSLNVIPDVVRVEGDLIARSARVINKNFTHKVDVQGGLTINIALFRKKSPPISFHGPLTLTGVKFPEELPLSPDKLVQWTGRPGLLLRLGDDYFELVEERGDKGAVYLLRGKEGAGTYVWEQGQWQHLARSSVSEALLNEINGRLVRFCTLIGVGAGYAVNHPRKVGFNIRKIAGYLRLLERECRARGTAKDGTCKEGEDIKGVLSILQDLERNVYGVNPDEPNIRIMLDLLGDRAFAAVTAANDMPRKSVDEQQVKSDLEYLQRAEEEELNTDMLLPSGTRTLLFLSRVLKTKGGQRALLDILTLLKTNFDALAKQTGLARKLRFMHLLIRPGAVISVLRTKCEGVGGALAASLKALESEFRSLESMAPTQVIREISGNAFFAGAPDTRDEKLLLSNLYSFKGLIDDIPVEPPVLVEMYRSALLSSLSSDLANALKVLGGKGDGKNVGAQVIAHACKRGKPTEFIHFLRRRLEWDHSVLKAFNAVTMRQRRMDSVAEEQDGHSQEMAVPRQEMPPDLKAYLHMKLGRICIRLNLGKGFLEQHPDSYRQNMEKLLYFLVVSYENAQLDNEMLTERARQVISDFAARLELLGEHIMTARFDQVHQMLGDLDDKYLRLVDGVLARARHKVMTRDLRGDIETLKDFSGKKLTLDRLFGTPERLLHFLNSVAESEAMKKEIYRQIKPVNKSFQKLHLSGKVPKGITINDILRDYDTMIAHLGEPGENRYADELAGAMQELRQRSLHEVLKVLAGSKLKGGQEAERDREFVTTLAEFETGELLELRLGPVQLGRLLMMHLNSLGRQDLKSMHESGALETIAAPDVVGRLLNKLKWYDSVISAYNAIA